MADKSTKRRRYHPLSVPVPAGREKEVCPVCRGDFVNHQGLVILCPGPGCTLMYHDYGDGECCWEAIDRCARPGCNGKEIDKARTKRKKDLDSIRYFARKVQNDEHLTEAEMLVFAQLLRDYPGIELSPVVLKKVSNAVKLKK